MIKNSICDLKLVNLYLHITIYSCSLPRYSTSIAHMLQLEDAVTMTLTPITYGICSLRGENIAEIIQQGNFGVLNEDTQPEASGRH